LQSPIDTSKQSSAAFVASSTNPSVWEGANSKLDV
jgi:hypothetical protein